MCRLWRFLKRVPSRLLFMMEATTTTADRTEDSGISASSTDESVVKKPKVTNIDPAANPELGNALRNPLEPINNPPPDMMEHIVHERSGNDVECGKDNMPKEPINKPPPDMTEPINRPPVTNVESRKNAESSKNKNKGKNKPKKLDFSKMPLDEKRSHYRCGNHYVTLSDILPWPDYVKHNHYWFTNMGLLEKDAEFTAANDNENRKVSLWRGDITSLEIDAIVNAANTSLRGGGGVDGCIHRAAGRGLLEECIKLHGCETGKAKITSGQKLPAKHVIHTVGPIGEREKLLESCYVSCLTLMKEHQLSSVAFCSISTGIYGYPNRKAAHVALKTVKTWLEGNKDWVGRIVFCVFLQDDLEVYQELMLEYFPCTVEKKKVKADKKKVKTEASGRDDDTVASKRVPKASNTLGEQPHRSKDRGRGRAAGSTNSLEGKPKPPLLSLVENSKNEAKTNHPKGENSGSTVESKPGHAGNASSSFREGKDIVTDEEKMDSSKGDTATVRSGTPESTADKNENDETTSPAVESEPGHAGNAGSSFHEGQDADEEKMDTSKGDTGDTATIGTAESTADKNENEERTSNDPADTKCMETQPAGDLSEDGGMDGADNHESSKDGSKISTTAVGEVSQPESMDTDEASKKTEACSELNKSKKEEFHKSKKEEFHESDGGTIEDETNEGVCSIGKRKKKKNEETSNLAVESKPGHAGNAGSSFCEGKDIVAGEENMDTSKGDTDDTATVGSGAPESTADKKENEKIASNDPADTKCMKTQPSGDLSEDGGVDGADNHESSKDGSKISTTDAREASQPESMDTDEASKKTGAGLELHKSKKEEFHEGEGGTIEGESNEEGWSIVQNKKKSKVSITSKV